MPGGKVRTHHQTGLRGNRVLNPAKRLAQRQQILLAMASVVARRGYDATTLDDVADEMGCTKGVIYYQFRSKAEIYVAMVDQVNRAALDRLNAIASSDEAPARQLHKALADLVRAGWQPMDYAAIRIRRPASIPEEDRLYLRSLDREYDHLFTSIVARGMESGEFSRRNPRLVGLTLINAVHSIFRWARPDGEITPEAFEREIPAMLLQGVLDNERSTRTRLAPGI